MQRGFPFVSFQNLFMSPFHSEMRLVLFLIFSRDFLVYFLIGPYLARSLYGLNRINSVLTMKMLLEKKEQATSISIIDNKKRGGEQPPRLLGFNKLA
jgi:hypothetical protein